MITPTILCADIVSDLVDCEVTEAEFRLLKPYTTGPLLQAIERHLEREAERRAEAAECDDGPLDSDYRLDLQTGDLVRIPERPE